MAFARIYPICCRPDLASPPLKSDEPSVPERPQPAPQQSPTVRLGAVTVWRPSHFKLGSTATSYEGNAMKEPTKRKKAPKDGTVQLSEKHYIIYGVPREIPPGMVLVHNQVRHTLKTRTGVRGFRAWFTTAPPRGFKKCGCGWSGLPHYSAHPEYKSETRMR